MNKTEYIIKNKGTVVLMTLALSGFLNGAAAADHHGDKNVKVQKMQTHMVERMDDMFKRLDKNNDGTITHQEMMKQTKDRFDSIDKNSDGSIVLDELPKDPKELKKLLGRDGKMKRRHHGKKKQKGKDHKKGDHKMRVHKRRAHKMNRISMMHRMDRNNDEMISFEEFSAPAIRRFKRGDRNGDGTITRAEVKEMLDVRVMRMKMKKKQMKKVREKISKG